MDPQSSLPKVRRIGAGLATLVEARRPAVAWPGGVVSFTFDDFPRSALLEGGRILREHGARGTYYAASALLGTVGPFGPVATADDVREAHRQGHEVGCHTRTHLNCAEATNGSLLDEVRDNAAVLRPLLGGAALTSFAYPFGATSPRAKHLMRRRFSTARGARPGINRRRLDTGELRANRIYDRSYDQGRLHSLIDENCELGGWLIFYTHDVGASPSDYGCRPAQLASVVSHAAARCQILRIADVSAHIRPV